MEDINPIVKTILHYLRILPNKTVDRFMDGEYIKNNIDNYGIESYTRLDGVKVYKSILNNRCYVSKFNLVNIIILNMLANIAVIDTTNIIDNKSNTVGPEAIAYAYIYTFIKDLLKDK